MYSCRPLHMDEQMQDDQLEPTYSRSVLIQEVALKICWEQWTIGRVGERGSGISVLMARHDDNEVGQPKGSLFNNDYTICNIHIYMRNIVNTIKTSEHSSLEKYTSHTLFEMVTKGLLCVRWVGDWTKTATYWPPSSSSHSSASFSFC